MQNQFVWVDIPVRDLARAIKFYSAVLGAEVSEQSMPGFRFGVLPHAATNVSGCLVDAQDNLPSQSGPLVYMNADGRLDNAISAVVENGGKVVKQKHQIGEHGYRAIIIDSEGNRIALHSNKG